MCCQGWYSTPTGIAFQAVRTGEQQCEPGYSCVNGIRSACLPGTYQDQHGQQSCKPCLAGKYGDQTNETIATCSGPCPAGYWCPTGTSNPFANPCGSASVFCSQGANAPSSVTQVRVRVYVCICQCVFAGLLFNSRRACNQQPHQSTALRAWLQLRQRCVSVCLCLCVHLCLCMCFLSFS